MELLERIVIDPGIMGGKPLIRGTRVPVALILKLLSQGWSEEDIDAACFYKSSFLEVWEDIKHLVKKHPCIRTLSQRRPNWIEVADDEGIRVRTERSGEEARRVPKSMFERAWKHLLKGKPLNHNVCLGRLGIFRSALVMAVLGELPYVAVRDKPVIELYLPQILSTKWGGNGFLLWVH